MIPRHNIDEVKIAELLRDGAILAIQDGNHGEKHPKASDYVDEGIPFIMAKDLNNGVVNLSTCNFLPKAKAERLRIGFAKTGDVLLSHKGTVGSVAIVPDVEPYIMLTPQVTYYRVHPEKLDNRYLAYAFQHPDFQSQLSSFSAQSTRPYIGITNQRQLEVLLPPLQTQRKIAAVLSAYDDLIENNTRRIEILEEMAQRIYREWFVHFRFPGHEKVRMVNSALGPIPEGWEAKRLGEICSYINRGISPKYDDKSVNIVVNQRCIRNGRLNLNLARRHSKRVPPEKRIQFGDGLINSTGIGTLGRVTQVYSEVKKTTVDTHVSIVRPGAQLTIDYFGLAILNLQAQFEYMGRGSTGQTELSRQSIADTYILVPDLNIQEDFSGIVAPMRRSGVLLDTKNANLRHTRDLLLPKLISGEIDVGEI